MGKVKQSAKKSYGGRKRKFYGNRYTLSRVNIEDSTEQNALNIMLEASQNHTLKLADSTSIASLQRLKLSQITLFNPVLLSQK